MSNIRKIFITVACISCLLQPVLSQNSIRLLDNNTGKPVSFAHVCFESLDGEIILNRIADQEGNIPFPGDRTYMIAASALGYITLIDTIRPGENPTLYLQAGRYEMDEVVVTAQYSPQRADRSIYNVKVIDSRRIREKGATNLSGLLNNELSTRVSNDAALGSSMSIQGLSGEHVKILIDGVPVIGRMNGNIDLSQLNLHNVDHIEMVEGPMSVVYGSNALAGAVNIITREHTRSKFSTWQNSYLESVGAYNFDLGAGWNPGRHSISMSGARNFFSGYSLVDTLRTRQWKPRLQYNLDGYYMYNQDRLGLKLDLHYFDETIQNKGPLLPPYYEKAFDNYYFTRRFSQRTQADYRFRRGGNLDVVFANSFYSRIKNTWFKDLTTLEEVLLPGITDHDTTRFTSTLIRLTLTQEQPGNRLAFQGGLDINLENGEGKRIQENSQRTGDYAAFFSLRYAPNTTILLQPGIRMGYNSNYKSPLVPSLNLRWSPQDGKSIFRASYARGFRAPSLKELYLYFVDINHNLRGNPDLKAEYSHNVNLTWDHTFDQRQHRHGFQAGFFYNTIHNRISLAVDTGTVYSYVNIDRYKTAGGKISYRYRLHPRLTFELGIFEIGRRSMIREITGKSGSFRFSTDISSSFSYSWLRRQMRFLVSYKYSGRLPQFYTDESGVLKEGFIEDYHMLDASANKSLWKERIMLGIGARNLIDYTNVQASGLSAGAHTSGAGSYPVGWGRTFYISLRLYFSKY